MFIATKESLTAICRIDGVIVAVSPALISLTEKTTQRGNEFKTLAELANLIDGQGLSQRVEEFATSINTAEKFLHRFEFGEGQVSLQKLVGPSEPPLILINLHLQSLIDQDQDLVRAGRLTSQLVHDFKNQIGGIKLYAAYLKKLLTDSAEGVEIAEKIVQGLNAMAERASLVSKLTRPLELSRRSTELIALLNQTINDHQARAAARGVLVVSELGSEAIQATIDVQQLRAAIGALIARAIDLSDEGGRIQIRLRRQAGILLIEVIDQGEKLSDQQLRELLDLPPGEKINQLSLSLAMSRRIIERHGGEAAALAAPAGGTTVQVRIPIRNP